MILTDNERLKFAKYCHENADDTELIIKELENIPAGITVSMLKKAEATAFRLVARILDTTKTKKIN